MTEKNATFPNGPQAVALVVGLLMAEFLVSVILYDMRGALGIGFDELGALEMVLSNAIVFTIVMHHKGLGYRALFHASPSSMAATVLVLLPAIALTIPFIVVLSNEIVNATVAVFPISASEMAMFARFGSGSFSMTVAICILAPVLEEMLFRGIILRSFLRQYQRWPAIAGSAALFGFAHLNLYQYIAAAITGIFLGWLYERTRSLLPCIALHAGYNAASLLACSTVPDGAAVHFTAAFGALALVLGLAGFTMLRRVLAAPAS